MTSTRLPLVAVLLLVAALTACGDDDTTPAASPTTVAPSATAAASPTEPAPSATPEPSATPAPSIIDPCTLRDSLEGQPLTEGPGFMLGEDLQWQLCIGGAAAGSSEKYLFMTQDGGVTWTLLSMTSLGNPPPEAGVGELPNGNAAEALFFVDAQEGWLGLSSPGQNLYRSHDGGVSWEEVPVLSPGLPVTDIQFADADHGTLTTPEGDWTTEDGGATWSPAP
jgi:hypothetical protein